MSYFCRSRFIQTANLVLLDDSFRLSCRSEIGWMRPYHLSSSHPSIWLLKIPKSRSQWPRSLRRRSAAARLLRTWVRIPPGTWMFVCCECCVLSGRGLCDELITRPEKSYRLWCVIVCDLETSCVRRTWPTGAVAPPPPKKKLPKRILHWGHNEQGSNHA